MTTLAATGVLRASWLLLAFPVFGAAVLLIGGRRTDKWGHLLAVLMSLASFVYGMIATDRPKSPTRLAMNAFFAATGGAGLNCQNPISR